jgi:hypothetical protein
MSHIGDTSYHKFLTGETVDAQGSPTGADLNPLFKIFQTAINDNFARIIGLNSSNISAPDIAGLTGNTINNQLLSLWLIVQGLPWTYITGKPTTLTGYGITDAATLTHIHALTANGDVSGTVTLDNTAKTMTLTLGNIVTPGTYTKVQVDAKGRVTSGVTLLTVGDIPTLTLSKISDAGTAASRNTGTTSGTVPLVGSNGLLDASIIPVTSLANTFVVNSQAAMLALSTAIKGDFAVRSDLPATFILNALPPSTLANWIELPSGSAVTSVAGKTGSVTLVKADVGLGNVDNESKATMFTNSTLTGNTTGFNWIGKLNGNLYSVAASAPATPTLDDMWFDTGNLLWKRWNGVAWDFSSGGGGGSVAWASITGKPTTTAGYNLTDSFVERGAALPAPNAGNRGREYVINGATGVSEVSSLLITAGSGANSNVVVTLDGVAKQVPVLTTDNTASLVATKIRAASYPGWTTGGSGTTVTFTSTVAAIRTDSAYSPGTTGATGTMSTTTQGTDGFPDEYYICIKIGTDEYDWKQKEG